jgi:hypothetical protein
MMREGLARLAEHVGISDRVVFEWYKPVAPDLGLEPRARHAFPLRGFASGDG